MTIAVVDDAGRRLRLDAPPQRIVSLVPSLTELVCDLGAAAALIGVTRFCTHPVDVVGGLERVGGTKNPDIAAILAAQPDLVLINSEENERQDFDALVSAGLQIFVSFPRTVAAAADSAERLSVALGQPDAGATLSQQIRVVMEEVIEASGARASRFFAPIWRNPWMSFNRDTFADNILRCAGGLNVCAELETRYPQIELEAIAASDPQVVLLPDEPYVFEEKHKGDLGPLRHSTAVQTERVHLIDGKALSWYGRRTPAALQSFSALLTS